MKKNIRIWYNYKSAYKYIFKAFSLNLENVEDGENTFG